MVAYNQYDIYWVELDPTIGVEVNKIRPCIIISPNIINQVLLSVVIVPITSSLRNLPSRINIEVSSKKGQVMMDQLRGIDKRRIKGFISKAKTYEIIAIKQNISDLFC